MQNGDANSGMAQDQKAQDNLTDEPTEQQEPGKEQPTEETISQALTEKEAQYNELAAQFTRLRADFDNYRRRTRQEMEDLSRRATEKLLVRLLPVLDNLDRAVEAVQKVDDTGSMYAGVDLVRRSLMETLGEEGLEVVPGVGAAFDPNFHDAVDRAGDTPTHVVAEYRKGYKLAGRVLRPSMVKVGPAPDVADSEDLGRNE